MPGPDQAGVADRIDLLADCDLPRHPSHRPPYLHLIPLGEIIALALGHKSPMTAGVQRLYNSITGQKTEIEVLLDEDITGPDYAEAEPKVIRAIEAFRLGLVEVIAGGGGRYGQIHLPLQNEAVKAKEMQRSLFDF